MPVLETRGLRKEYRMGGVPVVALQDVDLAVEPGEFVAVMGASGSGKSTLLHLLGGLDTASAGEIILAGQPFSALSDDELTAVRRRQIGFIFQFYNLLPTLTAEENIALPLVIDGQRVGRHQAQIRRLLDLVGLTDRRAHRPHQLSGGQQQRVAIARALVHNPAIVLADEPTGNLDSHAGVAILELLRHTCTALPATIVMVTHDPRAASYADRVIFLKDGSAVRELRAPDPRVPAIMTVLADLET